MPEQIVFRDAQPADLSWAQHLVLQYDRGLQSVLQLGSRTVSGYRYVFRGLTPLRGDICVADQ